LQWWTDPLLVRAVSGVGKLNRYKENRYERKHGKMGSGFPPPAADGQDITTGV